jgi:hypothetical protein
VRGLHADLKGQGPIQLKWSHGGIAMVENQIVRLRELHAEVADGGGLALAGIGREHAEPGIVDELLEATLQQAIARTLVEEQLTLRVLGKGMAGEPEAFAVHAIPPRRRLAFSLGGRGRSARLR